MRSDSVIKLVPVLALILILTSCQREAGLQFEEQGRDVPVFSADHAYNYIEQQVAFGPRVPNSEAHRQAIQYFRDHFIEFAGQRNVFVQQFTQEVYGEELRMFNLIAALRPELEDRIVLAAHWDSRPRGEQDSDHPEKPIPGADDGGSGVGVLMELATIFAENPPPIGVDIILFDGEDYGEESDLDHYFLGSRYWGQNPPVDGYNPRFGILLDMVGGTGATFPKEGYSMQFAPNLVNEIWSIARAKGYGDLFRDTRGGRIADDHIIVQRYTGIPMINIIHHTVADNGQVNFPPYWHTQADDMEIIDKETLQAVGDVLMELIYNRIPT